MGTGQSWGVVVCKVIGGILVLVYGFGVMIAILCEPGQVVTCNTVMKYGLGVMLAILFDWPAL